MDVKEIDLSHGDEYTCNVDLTKEELDWVYAYLQLTDDGRGVGRETLAKVCKNVEGMDEAQTSCMRLVMWVASQLLREGVKKVRVMSEGGYLTVGPDVPDDEAVKLHLKNALNAVYGSAAAKVVHPDEDCVLPGCDRYGGNDTYLRIRKVLGHKGAFDFCMGNVVKLVDRWDKKGDPVQNLEKLRDYSAQALVEWRLYNEMLS